VVILRSQRIGEREEERILPECRFLRLHANTMRLQSILRHVQPIPGFVYGHQTEEQRGRCQLFAHARCRGGPSRSTLVVHSRVEHRLEALDLTSEGALSAPRHEDKRQQQRP
jgi:hypothetical protein